jgi:drug/metabolite transporter (DMT)-like permease
MSAALLALAVLCLSFPAILIRFAHMPIEAIGFWRLLLAAAALSPLAWRRRGAWRGLGLEGPALAALSGALFFAHLWTFTYAAKNTSVSNLMTAFATHPLWTGAGAWLLFGERPTRRLGAAYALAGAGVWVLVAGAPSAGAQRLGDLSALAAALCFSGYVLASRRLRERLDPSFAAAAYACAALLFLLLGAAQGAAFTGHAPSSWAAIAGLAFGVTLGGHALFTQLMGSFHVNLLSCAKLLEPILASVLARLLFGEPARPGTAAAFALIAAGLLVLLWPARRAPAIDAEAVTAS